MYYLFPLSSLTARPLSAMLTDGGAATLLALRPLPPVLADGCAAALLALRPLPLVLIYGCAAAVLALGPLPVVLAPQFPPIIDTNPPLVSRYDRPLFRLDLTTVLNGTMSAFWPTMHGN